MPSAACSYCGRKGILIYPVRYAVACPNGKGGVPGLSGNFRIDAGPVDIAPAKFALRALRTGYLYTYEEKIKRLKGYVVLSSGALWEFPIEYLPTVDPERMGSCCTDRVSVSLSYCIDIDPISCETLGNLWIGWSNILWTKPTLAKMPEIKWREKHMQRIDTQAMLQGVAPHSAKFKDYIPEVPHFSDDKEALWKAFSFSNSPVQREKDMQNAQKDMGRVLEERCQYGGFIVAINDPVGICSDLSELTLPTDAAGFDEKSYWGKISGNLLDSLEIIINKNAHEAKLSREETEKRNPVIGVYNRWGRSMLRLEEKFNKKISKVPKPVSAWEELTTPEGKPLINLDAKKKFTAVYDKALSTFQPIAAQFDILHTAWMRSKQLSNWMQAVHDTSDLHSGVCYRESLSQCIGKSAGNEKCLELLKRWLADGSPSDEENLYARGLLFNQKEIIAATQPHLKKSDFPMEAVFNLYKRAVELVSKNGTLNSFDRLALSTANVLVSSFSKSASIVARNLTLVGLSLTGEVILKPSSANVLDVHRWILDECQKAGVRFNTSSMLNWAETHRVATAALEEYRIGAASVAIEIDVAHLNRRGLLSPDAVRVIKIPGFEQARRWISSNAPMEFRLGVVTTILQTIALSFAMRDWVENNETNRFETRWKGIFGTITLLSTITETAMATLAARSEHPLSIFLAAHWGLDRAKAASRANFARGAGLVASVAISCLDIWKGVSLILEKNLPKGAFYIAFGLITIGLSFLAFKGIIACWWLLVAAAIFSLVSPLFNEAPLQEWIRKSFFGTSAEKFATLDLELNSYRDAIGG
jgi:hypothetical protein